MSLPPTGGRGYMLDVGSARGIGDSRFGPRILSVPRKSFMVSALLRTLIGADFSLAAHFSRFFLMVLSLLRALLEMLLYGACVISGSVYWESLVWDLLMRCQLF
jgi:hypothetical protein